MTEIQTETIQDNPYHYDENTSIQSFLFYLITIIPMILQIIKSIKSIQHYTKTQLEKEMERFIEKEEYEKLIEYKKTLLKTDIIVQIYYILVTTILYSTSWISTFFHFCLNKYQFLSNVVVTIAMTGILFVIKFVAFIITIIGRYINSEKESLIEYFASELTQFAILIVTNLVLECILYFCNIKYLTIILIILVIIYNYFIDIVMIHAISPQQGQSDFNDKEKEELIIKTAKEYNVSIKEIKTIPYTTVSFVGSESNKTLLIGKDIIEQTTSDELCSYIRFDINNNFERSMKCFLTDSITSSLVILLLSYFYSYSHTFFHTPIGYDAIGLIICRYIYPFISKPITTICNMIYYQLNSNGLKHMNETQKSHFKDCCMKLLQNSYFNDNELKKLNRLERQQQRIEHNKALKYLNPNYRYGDDDDDGHDDDCECEKCEYERSVVLERAQLPNKIKASLNDITIDKWSYLEESGIPSLFTLYQLLNTSEKKSN